MRPTTDLFGCKAFGEDERSVLLGYLTHHRIVLGRKAEGLTWKSPGLTDGLGVGDHAAFAVS